MNDKNEASALSKSRMLAYRQCPKRLWLEIHRPDLKEDSQATQATFDTGNKVGDIARRLYDPRGKGRLIEFRNGSFRDALAETMQAMASSQPIFEAALLGGGAKAYADVMLPSRKGGGKSWRMIEVKSSTEVKDYQKDDVAVQAYAARKAGVPLAAVAIAHIDSTWVYPGSERYEGLLIESDQTKEAIGRASEVKEWIAEAQLVARKRSEPDISPGAQCSSPYECAFRGYCDSQMPEVRYPVAWIPDVRRKALKQLIEDGVADMREVPDDLLNERQLRVKEHTLSGKVYFDAKAAAAELTPHRLPAFFLDFETINLAVPVWKGTRPYQQIPFQFSVHRLSRNGRLEHRAFLDLSGNDPSRACAEALIEACGERGTIFAYNAGFEGRCLRELAARFSRLSRSLLAIDERILDLLAVSRGHYYHPDQRGSWSIKAVLPAAVPGLGYDALGGVQDGGMAMDAYREAISPATTKARKAQLEAELLEYCKLDTYAMVRLWQLFSGRSDLVL